MGVFNSCLRHLFLRFNSNLLWRLIFCDCLQSTDQLQEVETTVYVLIVTSDEGHEVRIGQIGATFKLAGEDAQVVTRDLPVRVLVNRPEDCEDGVVMGRCKLVLQSFNPLQSVNLPCQNQSII